jgi:hypothetical protein
MTFLMTQTKIGIWKMVQKMPNESACHRVMIKYMTQELLWQDTQTEQCSINDPKFVVS